MYNNMPIYRFFYRLHLEMPAFNRLHVLVQEANTAVITWHVYTCMECSMSVALRDVPDFSFPNPAGAGAGAGFQNLVEHKTTPEIFHNSKVVPNAAVCL